MNLRTISKKVVAVLLSLFMVAGLWMPAGTGTAMAATTYKSYSAIGDSLSAGYGPLAKNGFEMGTYTFNTGEGAYPKLIQRALGIADANYHSMTAVQLGVADAYYMLGGEFKDKATEDAYFAKANEYHGTSYMNKVKDLHNGKGKQNIQNSDLVTVAVGNIDLAAYPVRRLQAYVQQNNIEISISNFQEVFGKLKEYLADGMKDYQTYLPEVLRLIHEYNPNAKVMVFNQFNPYSKIDMDAVSKSLADQYLDVAVTQANQFLSGTLSKNTSLGTYVDITGLGEYIDEKHVSVSSPQNAITEISGHENHPGAYGHQWLRDTVMNKLSISHPAKIKNTTSQKYLAFTSDTHIMDNESSLRRLESWLAAASDDLGGVAFDYMGFCGDMGQDSLGGPDANKPYMSTYWNKVTRLMDVVDHSPYVTNGGVYTTGNHDIGSPGYLDNVTSERRLSWTPYNKVKKLGEAAKTNNYYIYCMGAHQWDYKFNQSEITAMDNYLKTCDSSKPVFILSHFPIHTNGDRVIGNADAMIQVLNKYPNAIFLWGHNHTQNDSHYNKVYTGDLDGKAIKFIYASAGVMSDSEYQTNGSGKIPSKGLVATINGNNKVGLTYYKADGSVVKDYVVDITNATSESQAVVPVSMNGDYVIANSDKYAVTSVKGTGYNDANSNYRYDGLKPVKVTVSGKKVTSSITDDMIWTITPTSDGKGYTIKHKASGQYLNDIYPATSTITGAGEDKGVRLYLDSKQAVWTVNEDGKLVGSTSGKAIAYQTNNGATEVFTLRSLDGNHGGDVMSFYSAQCEHTYVTVDNGNKTHSKKCSKCGEVASTENCNQNTKIAGTPATCSATGLTDGAKCSVCGAVTKAQNTIAIDPEAHNFDNGTVTKEGTCLEAGEKTYKCTLNNAHTKVEATAKGSHKLTHYAAVAATETKDGNVEYWQCDVCNKYFKDANGNTETRADQIIIKSSGHTHVMVSHAKVDATCAAGGNGEYWQCSTCEKIYADEAGLTQLEKVPATEKNPSNHTGNKEVKNAKAATCLEDGFSGDVYCKDCGVMLEAGKTTTATGHSWDKGQITTAATCTADGVMTYTCNTCKATKTEAIAMTGHKMTKHNAVAATETKEGNIEYYTCSNCKKYFTDQAGTEETTATAVVISPISHTHNGVAVPSKAASCTEEGYGAHYKCEECGKLFSDAECTLEIAAPVVLPMTDHKFGKPVVNKEATCSEKGEMTSVCTVCGASVTEEIEATGHDFSVIKNIPATTKKNGSRNVECSLCGEVSIMKPVAQIDSMETYYKTCTYSGKYKKPSVIVKDVAGNIINAKYYTVTYSKNKNIGTATAKVTFDGIKYKGTLKKTFKILPEKTSISKLTAKSKGFTVKWKEITKRADGYEIQYSTSKSFKTVKKVKISSASTTSKKISKLTAKKKYYVRVRTYKTVDGTKYYARWSGVKSVTTKK